MTLRDGIFIIGAGGHGKVVADILRAAGQPAGGPVVGFIDADPSRTGQTVAGLPVLGPPNRLEHLARDYNAGRAVVAIGDNRARVELAAEIQRAGLELASAIHPSANLAGDATLGRGVVVCLGASVGAEASVGDLCIINTNASVDHECLLHRGVHIAPGTAIAGRVEIGEEAFVGIGASVIQCRKIGPRATVGAGAVVIRDVPADATVVGTPAVSIHDKRMLRIASA